MITVTLTSRKIEWLRRMRDRRVIRPGGEELAGLVGGNTYALTTGGTPVFVLSAHDPDDPVTARWVP